MAVKRLGKPVSSDCPVIGTTIAHYRVLERLGAGGMGEVFLVEDTRLQRRAALKLIAEALTRDEARRLRFVQEARLAASIDHPHVAAIYDVGEADGRAYLVMEYVEGRSLRDLLRRGPLPLRQALDYGVAAAEALAKVHQRGVIHRDLKPENLLIARDGYLKIIDFGLAKALGPVLDPAAETIAPDGQVRTTHGVVMGTMGYMSPEQLRGEAIDARSDVFAFGAVLYEMVTGVGPFLKNSTAETIGAILAETPAPPHAGGEAADTELQRIIHKCLAKEPGSRYQGMRDLIVDLRSVRDAPSSGTASGTAPHPPETASAPPRAKASRAVTIAVAALAIAALALIVWTLARRRPLADASAELPARPAVAVVPFDVINGAPETAWLGKGLPSLLITGLAQTPDIELVGTERLSDAARQSGAAGLDSVERAGFADLARRAGARFLLNGVIVQAGGELRIDARIEDLVTGAVKVAETVRGADALALADDLAARVRRGLDVRADTAVRPVADVSTASIEAYRAYVAGLEAELNVRFDDAARLYEQAVDRDPSFGLAYLHLSFVTGFAGQITVSEQWLARAAGHLDRMSEREAIQVRAQQARAAGRSDEASRLLDDLVRRYPDSETAWMNASFWAFEADPVRALRIAEQGATAMPHSAGLLNFLGYGQLANGRIDQAIRSFERYAKLRPGEANALDSLAEGYLVGGRPEEALTTFRAAAAGGYAAGGGAGFALGVLGRYDMALAEPSVGNSVRALLLSRVGRYAEAEQALDAVERQHVSNGWIEGVASIHLLRATYDLERDRCSDAGRHVADAEQVLAPRPSALSSGWRLYAAMVAGVCDARSGRLEAAQRRVDEAKKLARPTSPLDRWWGAVLDGEVALARRDFDGAARAFASGTPAGRLFFARQLYFFSQSVLGSNLILRDGPARIAAAQGRTSEAIAAYRRLLESGPNQPWTAVLEPRYVLALARLLDRSGDRQAARAEYARFRDYWRQADANLPEVAAARAAMAR